MSESRGEGARVQVAPEGDALSAGDGVGGEGEGDEDGGLDEGRAEEMAAELVHLQEASNGESSKRKQSRALLLEWMLQHDRKEIDVGQGTAELHYAAQPIKVDDLLITALHDEPYNWTQQQIDDLILTMGETKERIAETKPVLRIRLKRRKPASASNRRKKGSRKQRSTDPDDESVNAEELLAEENGAQDPTGTDAVVDADRNTEDLSVGADTAAAASASFAENSQLSSAPSIAQRQGVAQIQVGGAAPAPVGSAERAQGGNDGKHGGGWSNATALTGPIKVEPGASAEPAEGAAFDRLVSGSVTAAQPPPPRGRKQQQRGGPKSQRGRRSAKAAPQTAEAEADEEEELQIGWRQPGLPEYKQEMDVEDVLHGRSRPIFRFADALGPVRIATRS
jgi:hypothetical protein